jgi:hypothetical protein
MVHFSTFSFNLLLERFGAKVPCSLLQLLAKTGPIVAQQGKNNKERWTKHKELSRMAVL